jgi:hypothetical protein
VYTIFQMPHWKAHKKMGYLCDMLEPSSDKKIYWHICLDVKTIDKILQNVLQHPVLLTCI